VIVQRVGSIWGASLLWPTTADRHTRTGSWGRCSGEQGRHREALQHAQQSLDLYRITGDQRGQAVALNAIGWYQAKLGDHQPALGYCRRALRLLRSLGDRRGESHTLHSLGFIHHRWVRLLGREAGRPGLCWSDGDGGAAVRVVGSFS
jgi:tetratricopeptide (TPR) repeat protein